MYICKQQQLISNLKQHTLNIIRRIHVYAGFSMAYDKTNKIKIHTTILLIYCCPQEQYIWLFLPRQYSCHCLVKIVDKFSKESVFKGGSCVSTLCQQYVCRCCIIRPSCIQGWWLLQQFTIKPLQLEKSTLELRKNCTQCDKKKENKGTQKYQVNAFNDKWIYYP